MPYSDVKNECHREGGYCCHESDTSSSNYSIPSRIGNHLLYRSVLIVVLAVSSSGTTAINSFVVVVVFFSCVKSLVEIVPQTPFFRPHRMVGIISISTETRQWSHDYQKWDRRASGVRLRGAEMRISGEMRKSLIARSGSGSFWVSMLKHYAA
jgi:hypothetical protein